ncbi:uncharacterized protein F4822DRAFT_383327 [Hypoxylon trugodes]|uniref:uncharacterized protein n=1 Tax=Hypoxylon trugodes TaxID=326681 RepID=UPI00219B1E22|nr:uncharacterized protein F4822DRAFT_383327 [Hypoxylon trugodes]KAI1385111.1 hypothetical protein F4822DRAFT_383327 [Hypoxylon trugodes]
MIELSRPRSSHLPRGVVYECMDEFRKLLDVFESFVDGESIRGNESDWAMRPRPPNDFSRRFPKLDRVLTYRSGDIIEKQVFRFDVSTVDDIQCAIETITEVNTALLSIYPTPIRSFAAPPTSSEHSKVDDSIRIFTENVLDRLNVLFSKCKYDIAHGMMVRFSGLRELGKDALPANLNLLLSSCASYANDAIIWQGGFMPILLNWELSDQSSAIGDLCSTIEQSLRLDEHLRFHLAGEELFPSEHAERSSTRDSGKLGLSLHEMIKANRFQRITLSSEDRFSIWEKRALALNLGILFMHLYDCKWTENG